jgi:hypothetical protein
VITFAHNAVFLTFCLFLFRTHTSNCFQQQQSILAEVLFLCAKVVLFAPAHAGPSFTAAISELGLDPSDFHLVPMLNESPHESPQLTSEMHSRIEDVEALTLNASDLGAKLSSGICSVRSIESDNGTRKCRGAIAVIGMDAPELSGAVVGSALSEARKQAAAYMCPANDGGYTLISLPPAASPKVHESFILFFFFFFFF